MRIPVTVAALAVTMSFAACTSAPSGGPISDTDLGLSKTSLFDSPAPEAFSYAGGDPGTNEPSERSYMTARPA